ncbi:glycosidase [Actinomyces ruminicola]|uniref:Alpha-glucosidase n=1 Tax=Actinomyces ruminicola TaxID=332524 RepID=A0A1G9VV81_9ACTO|nr:glycosidase [Actinomyces ruminicola]SDM76070.1 alpha-glucosidase [Actinomyces ruminicola]
MTTTTTLVHRAYTGPAEWWRDGLVYEIPSPNLGAEELDRMDAVLEHVASLGFGAILIRPSRIATDSGMASFHHFTERAHERGMRVIVRVSGALGPVTSTYAREDNPIFVGREQVQDGLVDRAASFLAAGADGVDLGTIVPPEVWDESDLEQLSEYFAVVHSLLAEYVPEGTLGADVSASYPEALLHHVQDDWLHHLRDDRLMLSSWDPTSLTSAITTSLAEHDSFGASPVWRYLPSYRLAEALGTGDGRRWFDGISPVELHRRSLALQTLVLALPGSVYLRQGDEVGLLDADKPADPLALADVVNEQAGFQGSQFASPLATVRHAIYVRHEHNLAAAPFAFVKGLEWCPRDVLVVLTRDVLVLVNASPRSLILPEHAEVLLSSGALDQEGGSLIVPPSTTAWINAATVA